MSSKLAERFKCYWQNSRRTEMSLLSEPRVSRLSSLSVYSCSVPWWKIFLPVYWPTRQTEIDRQAQRETDSSAQTIVHPKINRGKSGFSRADTWTHSTKKVWCLTTFGVKQQEWCQTIRVIVQKPRVLLSFLQIQWQFSIHKIHHTLTMSHCAYLSPPKLY